MRSWPELVGKDVVEARATIMKEDPSVYIEEVREVSLLRIYA